MCQGSLTTVAALVEERQASQPDVKLAYFQMEAAPDANNPSNFTIKQLYDVRFTPASAPVTVEGNNEGSETSQSSAAALLPLHVWNSVLAFSVFETKSSWKSA